MTRAWTDLLGFRWGATVLVTGLCLLAMTVLTPSPASARPFLPAGPVRPNLEFGGLVNRMSGDVAVRVACFGPVQPGQRGRVMGGQTLEVFRPEVLIVDGFTGSTATRIVAHFSDAPGTPVTFTQFSRAKRIPTSVMLPCGGHGQVVFAPTPSSPTAHSSTVQVHYVSQP